MSVNLFVFYGKIAAWNVQIKTAQSGERKSAV